MTIPKLVDFIPVEPSVAILMGTFNGQKFLELQLDSISKQTHTRWNIIVSDDGSTDKTLAIIQRYQSLWGFEKVALKMGPKQGFVANFLSLLGDTEIKADYYAYSDQDDIWEPFKLDYALNWLETIPTAIPALYCSRTTLVNENNRFIGLSPLFPKPPSFANALVQNIGGGNTMVFNHAARQLLQENKITMPLVSHDWWTYLVVTACGGKVFYDVRPTVKYRQHSANIIGNNSDLVSRIKRLHSLINGRFKKWNDCHLNALRQISHKLTSENCELVALFSETRQMKLIPRMVALKRMMVYRQTMTGNLMLVIAVFFNKM